MNHLYRSIRSAYDAKHGTIVTLMLVNNESNLDCGTAIKVHEGTFSARNTKFSDGTSFTSVGEEPAIEDESYEDFRYGAENNVLEAIYALRRRALTPSAWMTMTKDT